MRQCLTWPLASTKLHQSPAADVATVLCLVRYSHLHCHSKWRCQNEQVMWAKKVMTVAREQKDVDH